MTRLLETTFLPANFMESATPGNRWKLLFNKFVGTEKISPARKREQVPKNCRVYTIGDIHGRADLLQNIHEIILKDTATADPKINLYVIYLGDYVDRGMDSRKVIDLLIDFPLPGFESVYLRGNHDQELLNFLDSPQTNAPWLDMGGIETVYSYGVRVPKDALAKKRFDHIRDELKDRLPDAHLRFLKALKSSFSLGDYFFAHAGINPDRDFENQKTRDLIWGNKKFLGSKDNFGKVVVHGHTVGDQAVIRDNRICIDTGAFLSNILTCLVLENDARRLLSTDHTPA